MFINFILGSAFSYCFSCDAGTYSNIEASTTCSFCNAGFFQDSISQSTCLSCDIGTFTSASGQQSYNLCNGIINLIYFHYLAGTYQNITASTYCKSCIEGTYSAVPGSTKCDSCNPGYYSLGGISSCISCDPGYFSNLTSSSICSPCVPGKFNNHVFYNNLCFFIESGGLVKLHILRCRHIFWSWNVCMYWLPCWKILK